MRGRPWAALCGAASLVVGVVALAGCGGDRIDFGAAVGGPATTSTTSSARTTVSCDAYAASIAEAYSRASATYPADLVGQSRAIVDTLRRTRDDAPPGVAMSVSRLADAVETYADKLEVANLPDPAVDGDAYEEALAASGAQDALENDTIWNAQVSIWKTCPDLDSELEEDTLIAATLIAIGGSEAEMDEETQACFFAFKADTYGDNAGCDALQDACASGDMFACNDLYWFTLEGTTYSDFGGSCGGIAQPGDEEIEGACEYRDDDSTSS
jgi:hypothetical protein